MCACAVKFYRERERERKKGGREREGERQLERASEREAGKTFSLSNFLASVTFRHLSGDTHTHM